MIVRNLSAIFYLFILSDELINLVDILLLRRTGQNRGKGSFEYTVEKKLRIKMVTKSRWVTKETYIGKVNFSVKLRPIRFHIFYPKWAIW